MELMLNRVKLNHRDDKESAIVLTRYVRDDMLEIVVDWKFKKVELFALMFDVLLVI
jgi:hypothetical protein